MAEINRVITLESVLKGANQLSSQLSGPVFRVQDSQKLGLSPPYTPYFHYRGQNLPIQQVSGFDV